MRALALPLALLAAACATTPAPQAAAPHHPEARLFEEGRDGQADVDAALARAAAEDKRVLLVMGANWCHDSRAFAGWMEEPRFAPLLERHYVPVYVNMGMPQTGDGHNLDVARRFGVETVEGTPTVLVLTAEGVPVNLETAGTWRNTASRSKEAIHAELTELATR